MAFTRCKRSGYKRLGKMDFQRLVCAAKKRFGSYTVLKSIIVHREVTFDAPPCVFRLFFPKRKTFADIHRNVGLVCSVMIWQGRSANCSKPVIDNVAEISDKEFEDYMQDYANYGEGVRDDRWLCVNELCVRGHYLFQCSQQQHA